MARILDTNVVLRFLTQDHPEHFVRAREYIARLQADEETAFWPDTSVAEVVHTLTSFYRASRAEIALAVRLLIGLPAVKMAAKGPLEHAVDLYVAYPQLSFVDSWHAARALADDDGALISFDRGFDKVPGLRRIEP
jgi:predicted nucleic acid-binding protein